MVETGRPARLSVTLVVRDEEDRLVEALSAVSFADEVLVVVDAASRDRSEAIAREAGARVLVRPFAGFGPQKNAAAEAAAGPWVLSIDADEVVTEGLAQEVRSFLSSPAAGPDGDGPAAFRVPIRLVFLGRVLRFGRDTLVRPPRLYRKDRARFSDAPVHERLVVDGPVGTLSSPLLHRSYRDVTHYLEKLDAYTSLSAEAKDRAGRRAKVSLLPLRVSWDFFDRAILRLGFLDGFPGLVWAALSATSTLVKYLKLEERRLTGRGGADEGPEGAA